MTGVSNPYLILYNLLQWSGWLCALTQGTVWIARTRQLQGVYDEAGMGRTVSMLSVHHVPAAESSQRGKTTE